MCCAGKSSTCSPFVCRVRLTQAVQQSEGSVTVSYHQRRVQLDLHLLRHHDAADPRPKRLRSCVPTLFQYQVNGDWAVTSDPSLVPNWRRAVVLLTSGALAAATPTTPLLRALVAECAVDPFLWLPPCKDVLARGLKGNAAERDLMGLLGQAVAEATMTVPQVFQGQSAGCPEPRQGRRQSARHSNESRFSDGLAAPTTTEKVAFYAADYRSETSALQFCLDLPHNPLHLRFETAGVHQLAMDAVLRVYETQRQRASLEILHILPLYVYTYELDGDSDQIYAQMNRAMRNRDEAAISFWRPLIWQVDQALFALPAYKGKLFRGINMQFDEQSYQTGRDVCWPAFSSASTRRAVAEEFIQGGTGTLFFITSIEGRAISKYSRFPDEDEVLMHPNTVFNIESVLGATSDIGRFYSGIDNIAMLETVSTRRASAERATPSGVPGSVTTSIPWSLLHRVERVVELNCGNTDPAFEEVVESYIRTKSQQLLRDNFAVEDEKGKTEKKKKKKKAKPPEADDGGRCRVYMAPLVA